MRAILAKAAKLTDPVAAKELERTDLTNPVIGAEHRAAIIAAGDVLKKAEVVPAGTDIAGTADALIDPQFAARLTGDRAIGQMRRLAAQPWVRTTALGLVIPLLLLIVWELSGRLGWVRPNLLPPPSRWSPRLSIWRRAASCGRIFG